METLTKENFWDEMSQKYPKVMKHFLNWIDGYKEDNEWRKLFNAYTHISNVLQAPKYHELPIAMQFGIFLEWYANSVRKLFPGSTYLPHFNEPKLSITTVISGLEYWFEKGGLE
jgi:hypothetical protein